MENEKNDRHIVLHSSDAQFLANLKNEMLTQPTDGNCSPRFWVVMDTVRDYGYTEDYADGWEIVDGSMSACVGVANDLQRVKAALSDADDYDIGTAEDYEECDDASEVVEKANELCGENRFSVVYYRDRRMACENTFFLTKRECLTHISNNRHRYKNPSPYVMTAERSPEYERLISIIESTVW